MSLTQSERNKRYRQKNLIALREKQKLQARERRKKNPEPGRASAKRWAKNNPEKRKEIEARYKKSVPAKIKIWARNAQKRNPDLFAHHARKRRAAKRGYEENFPLSWVLFVKAQFAYECFACRKRNTLTLDHHYPLSRGYKLEPGNAVLLCRSCNTKKYDKLPENFYTQTQLEILTYMLNKQRAILIVTK